MENTWISRPLCCRYVFGDFKTLRLTVCDGDSVKDVDWRWALGLFAKGRYEVLGAWPAQAVPELVADDLYQRGVESFKAVSADVRLAFISRYPGAASWSSAEGDRDVRPPSAPGAFGPRRRAALRSAAATAERLQTSLKRAIRRSAPFADEVAAAEFLVKTLQRADRRF